MTTAFTTCRVTSEGDTTQNLNLNSLTPFETQNALSFTVSDDAPDVDVYPPVFAAGNGSILAVACGQVVHIVSILGSPKSKAVKEMDSLVSGLNFFQKGRILIIVLVDGTLSFCNFCEEKPQFHNRQLLPPVNIGCALDLVDGINKEFIKIASLDGTHFILRMDNYDAILASGVSIIEEQTKVLLNSCAVVSQANLSSDLTSIFEDQLISFPKAPGNSVGYDVYDLSKSEVFVFHKRGFAKIINIGSSTYALTSDGILHLLNNTLGLPVATFDLRDDKSFDDVFVNFNLVQTQNVADLTASLVLTVHNPDRDTYEIQIRNYPYKAIQYRIHTAPNVCVLPNMSTGDDVMTLVEPFHGKHYDEVLVRYIFEAHPQMRLEKLLLRGRFDDAEKVAKQWGINMEKIHIARVMDMLHQFGTNAVENSVLIARVKPYLDQITNHNEVGDLCVNAVTIVPAYQVILDFLEYASTRDIDDLETKRQLAQFSYDLATFAIIGDCDNHFDPVLWKRFVTTHDEVLTLFVSLWAAEMPAAARIIWARYKARICQFYEEQEDLVVDLIDLLQNAAATEYFNEVIEFVESELGVFYLQVDDPNVMETRGRVLIDFYLAASNSLECFEPTEFPANALNVCGMMDRLFEHMVRLKITPLGIEQVYKLFFSLGMGVDKDTSALGGLKIKHNNLRKMADLKAKYDLTISYDKFVEMNETSICFLLLEKTLTTNVSNYIKTVIIPYMDEHNLQKDQTLLDYVREISSKRTSADMSVTSPFQRVALDIASCIENPSFRCRAITEQARRSVIPWSPILIETVEKMLRNKNVPLTLIQNLQNQCRRAELGSYFLRYDIPVTLLRNMIVSTAKNVIKAIACKPNVAMTIRMNDAVAVFNLFREVFSFFANESAENLIYTLVIRHLMEVPDWSLKELQTIVLSIQSPELRQSQIKLAIGYCTALLNGHNSEIREQAMATALMLIRLSDAEKEYADVRRNVQCLQSLSTTFKATVMYNVLTERSKTAAKKLLLDFTLDATPTVGRIFSFGSLLGLNPMEIGATLLDELMTTAPISMLVLTIREMCQKSTIDKSGVVLIVQSLHGITQRMQEAADDLGLDFESARDMAAILTEMNCLGPVVDAAARYGMPETETLVTICSYLSLCDHVLSALVFDNQKDGHNVDGESKFVRFDYHAMSDQIPAVKTSDLGLLYDYVSVVRQIVRLASLCFSETPQLNVSGPRLDEMSDDLHYTLSSNPLITLIANTTVARFPCFKGQSSVANNEGIIRSIYQKLITESQIDLYACLLLTVHCNNEDVNLFLNELLAWATRSQNANAVYYLSFVMQVVALCNSQNSNCANIVKSFRSALWVRKFTKANLSIRNVEDHRSVREDLLNAVCPALLYRQYLVDMEEPINENLMKYGSGLLRRSNDCTDAMKAEKMRAFAKQAFMLVSNQPDEWAYKSGEETLKLLCSYTYESLDVILDQLEVWATNEKQLGAVQQQKKWLKLLKKIGRSCGVTGAEKSWFRRHQHGIAVLDDSMNVGMDNSFNFDMADADEPTTTNLPAISAKRLPFHIFLAVEQDKKLHDELRRDIVGNELNLHNADSWLILITDLNSPNLSRSKIVVWSISNRLREVVSLQCDLTPADIEAMRNMLIKQNHRKDAVIRTLAVEIKKLALCSAKVKAFEILEGVGAAWIKSGIKDPKERECQLENQPHLTRYWRRYQCELHFSKYGIRGVDTNITGDENAAILHIFTKLTNWSDRNDIHQKMCLARDIAAVYDTTLARIFGQTITQWLEGDGTVGGLLQPVNTTNPSGLTANAVLSKGNIIPPLPYNDIEVVRIAYMLTELVKQGSDGTSDDAERYIMDIAQCLRGGDNVSYDLLAKKLKILCIFMQALDSDGFQQFFNADISFFAAEMKLLILHYMFKTCSVEMPTGEYSTFDAVLLVKSFFSGRVRNPNHAYQLAAVTIVDRKLEDIPTIETTFKALMSSHLSRHNGSYIKMLLRHAATLDDAYLMKTLPTVFAETFKHEWYSLGKEAEHRLYRKAVYDILGCPIEAKYAYSQVIRDLTRSKMLNAVDMIARVSGLTADDISKSCGGIQVETHESSQMDVLPRVGSLLTALDGLMTSETTVYDNRTLDESSVDVKIKNSVEDAVIEGDTEESCDIEMDEV